MPIIINSPSLPFSTRNRRKRPRHGVGSLNAWLLKPGFMGLYVSRIELSPVDFNLKGMAFRCKQSLKQGEEIRLELMKDQHRLNEVAAVVRYVTPMANHNLVGVEFNFNASEEMRGLQTGDTLGIIESLVKGVVIIDGI